jgi:hypothetical protein
MKVEVIQIQEMLVASQKEHNKAQAKMYELS